MLSKRFFSENGEVVRLSMIKYGEELERQQKYHGATRWFVACLRVCSSFLSLESALASGDFNLAIRFIAREQTPQALEDALSIEFRDDEISPVDKGIRGADIKQVVKSPLGNTCGVILWEVKRTKNWTEGWVQKLKDDLRATKANIPVIVTEILPSESKSGIVFHNGVYAVKPSSALILANLLRKSLLDVGREKAIAKHRDTSADALYSFVTSHEFVQQIEAMVEVYTEMILDITKEKAVYDRIWAKRETQAKKLFGSTANIIGNIQGQIGSGSTLKIKGLEIDLLGTGNDQIV